MDRIEMIKNIIRQLIDRTKKIKNIILELNKLIVAFFIPYKVSDETLALPKEMKKEGFIVYLLQYSLTVISIGFSFTLKLTNMMIEKKLILIGIVFFMIYRGNQIIKIAFGNYIDLRKQKLDIELDNQNNLRCFKIFSLVRNKILKYDESNNFYKLMSNEEILNCISKFLANYWAIKVSHIFEIAEFFSIIGLLILAVATNTVIPQYIYIPMILFFILVSFSASLYSHLYTVKQNKNSRKTEDEKSLLINDLTRVNSIINNDLYMRIKKLESCLKRSNENNTNYMQKMNSSDLFTTIIEVLNHYVIIVLYLISVNWSEISLTTITEITATLVIVEEALSQVKKLGRTFNLYNKKLSALENEKENLMNIMHIYHEQSDKLAVQKKVESITIEPFDIRYMEESENDKPFKLKSYKTINLNKGEIAILYGPSGSGKSTFMKMLTEKIRLKKSSELVSTNRFLFYDETLSFGSLSIYEELFCDTENPNLKKMQQILSNLHLWDEISSNCIDVWTWMKEKKFLHSLSNGQKQRMILAKMLYWLDESIDVLVLDECTSGLDDKTDSNSADAEKILEYIVRFANTDKKRIIIISTHQNIEGFKQNLSKDFVFKNFMFIKGNEENYIEEF